MSEHAESTFDTKELVPAFVGFFLGLCILAFFIVLGLGLGLTPSIHFGCPQQ